MNGARKASIFSLVNGPICGAAGEELTIDYMVYSINWDRDFQCNCGSALCRGKVRGDDWRTLLHTYRLHFPHHLHQAISEQLKGHQSLSQQSHQL